MLEISTDKNRLDIKMIHAFLTESYWAKGRTLAEVQHSIDNSLCFGAYVENEQIGFARLCTDYTVFAYLMDVFVLPEYRGNGYSKQLLRAVIEEPLVQNCHIWMLKTLDAHKLYTQFGFTDLKKPEMLMERITT